MGEAVALARCFLGCPLGPVQRAAIACRRPPARWRSSGLLRYRRWWALVIVTGGCGEAERVETERRTVHKKRESIITRGNHLKSITVQGVRPDQLTMALIDNKCSYPFRVAIIPKRLTPLRLITSRLRFGCTSVTHQPIPVSGTSQYLALFATTTSPMEEFRPRND